MKTAVLKKNKKKQIGIVNYRFTPKDSSETNRPFPSSPGPLFQNEGRCSAFDVEIIFFIFMQIELIFTRKVVHLASF